MTSFIDTHCHLDKLKISPEDALAEAKTVGVHQVITISVDEPSFDFVEKCTQDYANVYGTIGIHPHDAVDYTQATSDKIQKLVKHKKIVAIGEIGLDYHYEYSVRETQKQVFRKQLKIAADLNLPVVLHSREAEEDTLKMLEEIPIQQKGVAHSFTSSFEMAQKLVEKGWYLGINGIVTFKKTEELRKVVQWLPIERLLLETDAPFLSPVPYRGKPNTPSRINVIAEFIADLKNISLEDLAFKTNQNAQSLFHLNA